jgi:ATP-binding cassette subfamily F protein uup
MIAKNGSGKSTLLNIIMDKEPYDEGKITFRRDLRIGYLPQNPVYPADLSILDACLLHGREMNLIDKEQPADYETKIKALLSQLKINDFEQKIKYLSGGQLKRVALANTLVFDPDLLILDEPTNHLDLDMTEWLEGYLRHLRVTLLMVTHDRYFLDRVCNEIMEIDNRQLYSYKGNYSYYLEKRAERVNATNVEIARANNLYRTELEWMRRMPQARGHKARYREEAFYELEKVAKQSVDDRNVQLNVKASYIGKKIFEADHLYKSFGDKKILDDFSYVFTRYEKMGIVGNNGTGKSTFLKILMGLVPYDKGELSIGETVRFGYYSQDGMEFDEQMKVIDVIADKADYVDMGDGNRLSASQFLQHFLFSPQRQHDFVYKLSGGERRRLYLCTVLMGNPNFLILDEPTNDLDIVTLTVLEDYLLQFNGCLLVVSHDRYFMDKIVDHLFVFNGEGDIRNFPGSYSDYREWRTAYEKHKQEEEKPKEVKDTRVRTQSKVKLTYKERLEMAALEKEIDALETEKKEIEEALCSGTLTTDKLTTLSKHLPEVNDSLDEKSMRWLELSEKEQG